MSRGGDTPSETPIKLSVNPGAWVFGNLLRVDGNYEMEIYTHGESPKAILANDHGFVISISGPEGTNNFAAFLEGIMKNNGIEVTTTWFIEDKVLQIDDTVPEWNKYIPYS